MVSNKWPGQNWKQLPHSMLHLNATDLVGQFRLGQDSSTERRSTTFAIVTKMVGCQIGIGIAGTAKTSIF